MKKIVILAMGTMLMGASAAHAGVDLTYTPGVTDVPAGYGVYQDFSGSTPQNWTVTGTAQVRNGTSGDGAQPAGYSGNYLDILGGSSATFDFTHAVKGVNFIFGSIDPYNSVYAVTTSSGTYTYTGDELLDGGNAAGQQSDTANNGMLTLSATGNDWIKSITIASTQNSAEIARLSTSGAVPEPASWAMMLGGFGLAGAVMRMNRQKKAVAFG